MHSVVTTAAHVADSRVLPELLHGEERKVWGDGGYQGQTDAIQEAAPNGSVHDLQADQIQEPGGCLDTRANSRCHNFHVGIR